MKIQVLDLSKTHIIPVRVHDCYEVEDYSIEECITHNPLLDQDEKGLVAVCNVCGKTLPDVDIYEGLE